MRPLALTRKNALFAGSDGGAAHWAVIASLIETCKLIGVEPRAYLADVISRIVNGHPQSRLDELLPWAYPTHPPSRRPLKKQNTAYDRRLGHGRTPHRPKADPAPGLGAQRPAADRTGSPPVQVVVRPPLRSAVFWRDLLVHLERGVQAVLC